MSRWRLADELKLLQQKQTDLLQQVEDLKASKRALLLRQSLLATWCDALSFLQLNLPPGGAGDGQPLGASHTYLQQREAALLQQLESRSSSGSGGGGAATRQELPQLQGLLEPEEDTIAPCTEPMGYLCSTVSRGIAQECAGWEARDLGRIMQRSVLSVSIKMHQLENLPPWEQPPKKAEIASLWDSYMHNVVSMILLGRQDVLELAHTLNLETLEPEPAEAAAQQASQAALLVPMLALSEQQQELIAVGMSLYYDLVRSLHKERQQLQLELAAAEDTNSLNLSREGDRQQPGSHCSRGMPAPDQLAARQAALEEQQRLTGRLQALLQKEYHLRLVAMGWFCGGISYLQLSKLAVMVWPYGMRVLFLATEIMQQREKLVKQRRQLGA